MDDHRRQPHENIAHASTTHLTENPACTEAHRQNTLPLLAAPLSCHQADAPLATTTHASDLRLKLKSKAASAILGRNSGAARQPLTHNIHRPNANITPMQAPVLSCGTENLRVVAPILRSTRAGGEQVDAVAHSRRSNGAMQDLVTPALWDPPKPTVHQDGSHDAQSPLDSVLAQQVQSSRSARFAEEASLEGVNGVDAPSRIQTQAAMLPTVEATAAVVIRAADCVPDKPGDSHTGLDGMDKYRSPGLTHSALHGRVCSQNIRCCCSQRIRRIFASVILWVGLPIVYEDVCRRAGVANSGHGPFTSGHKAL